MELTEIKSKGISWGYAAQTLNNNFEKIDADVEKLKYSTSKVKGFFKTGKDLNEIVKQASVGEIAYVGTSSPYQIWSWDGSKWMNTESTENVINVNMSNYYDKNEINEMIKFVYDGGRADTMYGGARNINGGNAYQ